MKIKTSIMDAVHYIWNDEYSILFWLVGNGLWNHTKYGSIRIKVGFFCIEDTSNENDDN